MARYIIGDLQGCYHAFNELLSTINFDDSKDALYFCGDLVARGEDSLQTLRKVKQLSEKGAAFTVLGNHDITLVATWLYALAVNPKDNTLPILQAKDCEELLHWLKSQPFILEPDENTLIVHAGIPFMWDLKQVRQYAGELHAFFAKPKHKIAPKISKLYSKKPCCWQDNAKGMKRLRLIANYLTRMRLIDATGCAEFSYKKHPDQQQNTVPTTFLPWYTYESLIKKRIFFGHWAALEGKICNKHAINVDGGAVWGKKLIAHRLEDDRRFYHDNSANINSDAALT